MFKPLTSWMMVTLGSEDLRNNLRILLTSSTFGFVFLMTLIHFQYYKLGDHIFCTLNSPF